MESPLIRSAPDPRIPTVASDLEGTLTSGVTIRAIHKFLEENGARTASLAIYRKRMLGFALRRLLGLNTRQAKNAWMRDVIRQYAGVDLDDLRRMGEFVVENSIWRYRRQNVVEELAAHVEAGRRVIIVTGMSTPILEALLDRMPGVEAIGTRLKGSVKPFSGELGDFTVGPKKAEVLMPFCNTNGQIYAAYGDTFSDSAMLALSEKPVAVHPDRKLRQLAQGRNWRILES